MDEPHDSSLIRSSIAKFAIGFSAACSLLFLPPLMSWVTLLEGTPSDISQFSWMKSAASVAIAIMIGAITVIHEYRLPVRPWQVFTRALAIPGLVMGSWHSLGSTAALRDSDKKLHDSERQVCEALEIPSCGDTTTTADSAARRQSSLPTVSGAHLASIFPTDAIVPYVLGAQLGATVKEGRYLLVLGRPTNPTSKPAADSMTARLRKDCCPTATSTPLGKEWVVVDNPEPRSKSDALKRAIELRKFRGKETLRLEIVAAPK